MIPKFETKRLMLKAVTLEDAPAYVKHFIDYEVIRYLSSAVPWPYPESGVTEYIKEIMAAQGNDRWFWGIFLKENPNELIGVVDLWRPGHPEHRGFWLSRKFWRQGIMTEAVLPIMDYAFDSLGFETMVLSNALGNVRSRRVKEKTGARYLGVRAAPHVDPTLNECEDWEITKEAWKKFRAKK